MSNTPKCDAEGTELVAIEFARSLERGGRVAVVAALDAGQKHCSRLIKKYPVAPAAHVWAFVRDLLAEMRQAASIAND